MAKIEKKAPLGLEPKTAHHTKQTLGIDKQFRLRDFKSDQHAKGW